jgi:hypothetical protein
MTSRHLTTAILFGAVAAPLFGTVQTASASMVMVVSCSPATGLNIASDIEQDKPKDTLPQVYDPDAKAYVSHPRTTNSTIINVNSDGTASETLFNSNGALIVTTNMHILGAINASTISMNANHISMISDGPDFALFTLYPKESIAISTCTSYFGWRKAIPIGWTYISHCKFSGGS